MERKTSRIDSVKVIDEKQGIVEAFVNTMGVVDKDGDVISPNAFDKSITDNLPIPVLSGHNQGEVVGKVLSAMPVQKDNAYQLHATMQMNMDTQSGREAYSNVAGEYVREWSIGFNMPDNGAKYDTVEGTPVRTIEELDWVETSTVIRGASPDTATISAKSDSEKDALPVHDTGVQTEGASWDATAEIRRIPNDSEASKLRKMYAYIDPEKDPATKAAYKFPHHIVSVAGEVGLANIKGCQSGIGVLNGAMGGADIPDKDRQGVWKHLAAHLKEADLTPAELRSEFASDTTDEVASDTELQKAKHKLAEMKLEILKSSHKEA